MGTLVMKKIALLATALAMVSGSAFAADMSVKARALKAPPPAAFDPWDVAFGAAIMNDYVFRDPVEPQAVGRGLLRAPL